MPQTWHHGLVAKLVGRVQPRRARARVLPALCRARAPTLDVACGTGRLLVPWLEAGLDVDGCDVSADMIELCRERAERAGILADAPRSGHARARAAAPYRTIVVCGAFGLGSTREQDAEALARFHRAPGSRRDARARQRGSVCEPAPLAALAGRGTRLGCRRTGRRRATQSGLRRGRARAPRDGSSRSTHSSRRACSRCGPCSGATTCWSPRRSIGSTSTTLRGRAAPPARAGRASWARSVTRRLHSTSLRRGEHEYAGLRRAEARLTRNARGAAWPRSWPSWSSRAGRQRERTVIGRRRRTCRTRRGGRWRRSRRSCSGRGALRASAGAGSRCRQRRARLVRERASACAAVSLGPHSLASARF